MIFLSFILYFLKKINWNRILSLPFLFLTQFPHLHFPSNLFLALSSQVDRLLFINYYTHIFMNAYIHVYVQIHIHKTFWVCVFLIICKWFRADHTEIGHSMRGLWKRLILLLSAVMTCLYILPKGWVQWDFSLSILIFHWYWHYCGHVYIVICRRICSTEDFLVFSLFHLSDSSSTVLPEL